MTLVVGLWCPSNGALNGIENVLCYLRMALACG